MPNQPDIHGASILIVDDCSDTGSVLCELLKQSGYKNVSAATDGSALLCVDTANHYSLLLLDMHMPKLGGLEIMQQLHRKQTRNCVPVIAISGDQRYRTVAIAAGAYAFLIKPFNPGELESTIYSTLSHRRERLV